MQSTLQTRALAQAVLDYIELHPERHVQNSWQGKRKCGTTMCVAGTAYFLAHREPFSHDVEDEATRLLGLEWSEAQAIFFEMSEAESLRKLKKVALGIQFDTSDFDTSNDEDSGDYPDGWDDESDFFDIHALLAEISEVRLDDAVNA